MTLPYCGFTEMGSMLKGAEHMDSWAMQATNLQATPRRALRQAHVVKKSHLSTCGETIGPQKRATSLQALQISIWRCWCTVISEVDKLWGAPWDICQHHPEMIAWPHGYPTSKFVNFGLLVSTVLQYHALYYLFLCWNLFANHYSPLMYFCIGSRKTWISTVYRYQTCPGTAMSMVHSGATTQR